MVKPWALHILFVLLIVAGIAMKRFAGLPQWLPPFHIAALIVLAGISLSSEKSRRRAGDGDEDGDFETNDEMAWDDV